MREIALGYVLVAALTSSQVVALVVASRVRILLADLLVAGLFILWPPRWSRAVP